MKDYLDFLFRQLNDDKVIFCHGKKNNLATQLGEIKQIIFSLAHFLSQQKTTSITLYCDNIYHFYIGFFSALITNKSIILPPNNTCGVFEDISNNEDIETLHFDEQRQCFCFNKKPIDLNTNDLFENKINDCLFIADIIFFTSGSTGKPKKITKKFNHLVNEVNILNHFFNLDKELMVTSSVHHQHLYGFIFYFLWPSLMGRPIYSQRIELSEELAQLSDINHQFIFISSPALLSRLTFEEDLSKITCFSAGSLLKNEVAQELLKYLKLTVNEILGSSETGIIAWRQQLNNPLWQCFDDVQISQNKDLTLRVYADSFIEPFIDTDDVIKLIKPNQFILQGRKGRIVKLEDKRLSLTELEDRLKHHPWIDDCYALKLEKSREYIGIFIVLSPSGKQQKEHLSTLAFNNTLRHFLSHWFEKILLPKSFRYGDEIPVNAQSKIDREAILQLFMG
ncbi:AMP-binding protein [Cysteiniphilum sp. QT6929]|uniref:AMP-binding protein n=1 Tax=Cysteiniphilum sp. QT6929 TaxID=2975055 RepID=UPI0024B34B6D|nr:AMP-binding protein [Cysteiniphilum sp. QT6929]WHN64791.1 AMP-binding protein [Cysteiniphilum sp. QT6929]